MATPMNFKLGEYTAGKFDNTNSQHLTHVKGTVYLATNDLFSAHLIYDDGTNFLDIVPRMIGYHNGGVGSDLTAAPPNATFIQNSTQSTMTWVASAKGAYYSTGTNVTPKFGTLPVGYGGTGKTSFTKYGIVYGNSSSGLKVTAAGTEGMLLTGGGTTDALAAPSFVTPTISWSEATSNVLLFNLGIGDITYSAQIPNASTENSGVVTTGSQIFAGYKTFRDGITVNGTATFNSGFSIVGGIDAYYNTNSDQSTGSLSVTGGITSSMNMRVDGGTIQFKKAGKIQYDDTKECFNFVFM